MVRMARRRADSGFYHLTMRGDGGQLLFEDDDDRNLFLSLVQDGLARGHMSAIAWCLMDNHVHLAVRDQGFCQSEAIHWVSSTYAQRFNRKAERCGHVFQGRFGSFPLEGDAHLLSAVRYIHLNPEKAGICRHQSYRWSSYGDYLGLGGFVDTSIVLDMVGGPARFVEFSEARKDEAPYRASFALAVPDEDASPAALRVLARMGRAGLHPSHIRALSRAERDAVLGALREEGLAVSQVSRLTGLGSATVKRATRGLGLRSHKAVEGPRV